MKKLLYLILVLVFTSYGKENPIDWLQRKITSSNYVEAEFLQRTYDAKAKTYEKFSGKFIATKPFTIKINYEKPFEQIIFITKDKTILYTPSENQAFITKRDTDIFIEDLISLFLNTKPLKTMFDIQTDGNSKITLIPKNNRDIKEIELIVKNDTIQLITVKDNESNKFELEFKTFNFSAKKQSIDFELPKDVKLMSY